MKPVAHRSGQLDDAAADFEVGHHLEGVHDGGNAAPGALDELADLCEQAFEAVRIGPW